VHIFPEKSIIFVQYHRHILSVEPFGLFLDTFVDGGEVGSGCRRSVVVAVTLDCIQVFGAHVGFGVVVVVVFLCLASGLLRELGLVLQQFGRENVLELTLVAVADVFGQDDSRHFAGLQTFLAVLDFRVQIVLVLVVQQLLVLDLHVAFQIRIERVGVEYIVRNLSAQHLQFFM